MDKIITNSPEETKTFAKELAKTLKGGEIIGLVGGLGAGKTTFTKGLAEGLGATENVNSPTFVIMKIYPINYPKNGIKKIVHIDAYRLNSEKDLFAIGAYEFFTQNDTVTIVEWPENIKRALPQKAFFLDFTINNNERTIVKRSTIDNIQK